MGKRKTIIVGEVLPSESKSKKPKAKSQVEKPVVVDIPEEAPKETAQSPQSPQVPKKESEQREAPKKERKTAKKAFVSPRSRQYKAALKKFDREKLYPIKEAVEILKKTGLTGFIGSVDVHMVVIETGLKGEINFPHSTGKVKIIRTADEQTLKELEQGKINFTVLVASPADMPRLIKFAKLLGPRGLMPNPKSGTISSEPEKLAKKLSEASNSQNYKTEVKAPLIHITIGKANLDNSKIEENFIALINAVGKKNIFKTVLTQTMGPGIKVDLTNI